MAEIFGVATGAFGIASLAIQLVESTKKLKVFCDDLQNAPQEIQGLIGDLERFASLLETIASSSQMQEHALSTPQACLLNGSLGSCKRSAEQILVVVRDMEDNVARRKRIGAIRVALKKDLLDKYVRRLEQAKTSLALSYTVYWKYAYTIHISSRD